MPTTPAPPLPLRTHLARHGVGLLLPVFVFAAVVVVQLAREQRAASERRLLHAARALGASFEREISGSVRTLQALAESDLLTRADFPAFRAEGERVRASEPTWACVTLLDPEGHQLVSTSHPPDEALPDVMETESFRQVLQTHAPAVGNLARRARPQPPLGFAVRVPVVRDGLLRYVLSALVAPEALGDIVRRDTSGDEEWTRTLVDQTGVVAARTRAPERFVGQQATSAFLEIARTHDSGSFPTLSLEGEPVLTAISRSHEWGWTAAVVGSRRALDAPVLRSLALMTGLGLAILLLSGATAIVASRRLTRSLAQATAAAEALANGSLPPLRPSRVSELALLGEALERSNRLLRERERERDEHLAAEETARAQAVEATRAKDEFLALLGHELRNPLAPITTALELLRQRGLAATREHEVIDRHVRHMQRLVDDLLDLARLTRGGISLRPVPVELSAVCERACEMVAPLLEQRRHALQVEVPQTGALVDADPDRLAQVVTNLLVNAAKYTPPAGRVRLAVEAGAEELALVVEDSGQGIAADLLPRLFDPFVQGPRSLDRSEGGLGLGLALVRRLVEAHGGRVAATSPGPGQGSTFRVVLPRSAAPAPVPAPAPAPAPAPPARSLRILVVDDNADAADLFAELLTEEGFEVAVAHDGAAALARLEHFTPEVAILDIGLPVMDGYALARHLQERLGAACPVLLALSGYGQASDREKSRAAGFRQHFVKPPDVEKLVAALDAIRAELAAKAA